MKYPVNLIHDYIATDSSQDLNKLSPAVELAILIEVPFVSLRVLLHIKYGTETESSNLTEDTGTRKRKLCNKVPLALIVLSPKLNYW